MPGRELNLLSLDGGGVRGLSSLYILQRIMNSIDPENPPKPCDYFDIIGGTSTGGLIAIMLGRLEMSVDECIKTYTELSKDVFHKTRRIPIGIKGDLKERYDSEALAQAVKRVLRDRGVDEDTLLKNPQGTKVFVCCTSGETSQTALLRTWHTTRGDPDLYRTVRIWEAARATSAASTFFDSITIGDPGQRFLDGGTGANNPIRHLWGEAVDLLSRQESLLNNLGCLISIGTGQPGYKRFEETVQGIGKALLEIATETETTANEFHRYQSRLFESKICFRFNVPRGLGDIGLAETEQISAIKSMTSDYLQTEAVQGDIRMCVQQLGERQILQPFVRLSGVSLQEMKRVTEDEGQDFYAMSQDSHWQLAKDENSSRDLLDRISTYQPQPVHCKINMLKTAGTTEWIVEDLMSWIHGISPESHGHQRCLWLSGIVGCGKTFLANTLVQTLLDIEEQASSRVPVAHFYFDPNQHDSLTTEDLLRSCVKQFIRHLYGTYTRPPLPISKAIKRIFGSCAYQLDLDQLMEILLKPMIQRFESPFLVVDGLDLCTPHEYKIALDCFSNLLKETSIHIIICGRDELNVTARLPGSVRVQVTRAKITKDIALFITQYIKKRQMSEGPISNNESTIARIRDTLIDQAGEMFLWARLQIDVLWDTCNTDAQINLALSNLPKDLDETYERCLLRVHEKRKRYSLRVLRYVYEAKTPLTINALGEVLATDPDTGSLNHEQIPAHTVILRSAANLIVFDEVECLVIPAHHSVTKFMDSSKADVVEDLKLWFDAEFSLGEMCIAHLSWHAAGRVKVLTKDPNNTQVHLPAIAHMSSWINPPNRRMSRLLESLHFGQRRRTSHSATKQAPLALTQPAKLHVSRKSYGPFHAYARMNCLPLSRALSRESAMWTRFEDLVDIREAPQINALWSSEDNMLGWAISHAHLPLLDSILKQKVDFSIPMDEYGGLLPLHLAAKQGHRNVFRRIYDTKNAWKRDCCPMTGRTALHYAAEGHPDIVAMFSKDRLAMATTRLSEKHRSPLDVAIIAASLETIEIMDSKLGDELWQLHHTDNLLSTLSAGGSRIEVVDYVVRKMSIKNVVLAHERIVASLMKHNHLNLVPSLVKAGVSLNVILDDQSIGRNQYKWRLTKFHAIFWALEDMTPVVATEFIKNGANWLLIHSASSEAKIALVDIILSRGWTPLASLIFPSLSPYECRESVKICLTVTSTEVRWLSILMVDWIITKVECDTQAPCPSETRLLSDVHQRFLFARYQDDGHKHSLVVNMVCPKPTTLMPKFKLMMGVKETKVSDWRDRLRGILRGDALIIKFDDKETKLGLNGNPYNLQLIGISDDGVKCSTDTASWYSNSSGQDGMTDVGTEAIWNS